MRLAEKLIPQGHHLLNYDWTPLSPMGPLQQIMLRREMPQSRYVEKKMHCGWDSGLFALLSFLAVQFVCARENLPPRFLSKTSSTRLATLPYRGRHVLVSPTKSGAPTRMFVADAGVPKSKLPPLSFQTNVLKPTMCIRGPSLLKSPSQRSNNNVIPHRGSRAPVLKLS